MLYGLIVCKYQKNILPLQPKRIKKGHQMGDIIENENISADYSMKYSDEDLLLLDDAKLLAMPRIVFCCGVISMVGQYCQIHQWEWV